MWTAIIELIKGIFKMFGRGARIERMLQDLDKRMCTVELVQKRIEFLKAMERNDVVNACKLYDEYKAMGGNSYAMDLFQEFMKKQKKSRKKK